MNAKHTPGPWFYGIAYEPERGPQPLGYRGPGYYKNAGVLSASGQTIVGCDEYDIFGPMEDAEREANVALITAAPDLLDALREIIEPMEPDCGAPDCPDCEPWRKARAAIAKAEGQP